MTGPSHEQDPVSKRVMATGPERYFTGVSPDEIVDARVKLIEAADSLELFLRGEGRGSGLDGIYDDLSVAGLRTSSNWIEPNSRLRGSDFYELFEIAVRINVPPIGQSEAAIQSEFEEKIRAFVHEKNLA